MVRGVAERQTMVAVAVVYHASTVATGHGLLNTFWPVVIGRVLRTAESSYQTLCITSMRL